MPHRQAPKSKAPPRRHAVEFPPRLSSGYLVLDAHRAFQRLLERRIAPYGVTRGQWYFLRVLWTSDGLSQRELSARVGMMEPTTVIALRSMERAALIRRVRGDDDRRKVRVFLTVKAKRLRDELLTVARTITAEAEAGIVPRDLAAFRRIIARMTANLDRIER
jgi:MarR family transcriptional regulator, organic hydroperoxide resistance regulator